jgi:hypothetical protein
VSREGEVGFMLEENILCGVWAFLRFRYRLTDKMQIAECESTTSHHIKGGGIFFLIEFNVADLGRLCCMKGMTMSFSCLTLYTFTPLHICGHHNYLNVDMQVSCQVGLLRQNSTTKGIFTVPFVSVAGFCLALVSYYSEALSD